MKQKWIFLMIKGKESACSVEDMGLTPGFGRYLGEGKGYPVQYSGLENSKDYTVQGVEKSQSWLCDFHFTHKKNRHDKPLATLTTKKQRHTKEKSEEI